MEGKRLSNVWRTALVSSGLFLFFFGVFMAVHFSHEQVSSPDDPFYNISHSYSYVRDVEWRYPIYSTFHERPVDLYVAYHMLLSYAFRLFNANDYTELIVVTKIFHSVVSASVFVVFFLLMRVFAGEGPTRTRGKWWWRAAAIASVILFFVSPQFSFRLIFYRGYIFSIIGVLLSFYFCLKRRYVMIFLTSFLLPFFYSVPFLVLIPAGMYAVAAILYAIEWPKKISLQSGVLFIKQGAQIFFKQSNVVLTFCVSVIGLVIGIIVRPDSLNYLYNGTYVILVQIVSSLRGVFPEGGEISPASPGILVSILFIVICFIYVVAFRERGIRASISFDRFYLFVFSFSLFILTVLVGRAVEYAAPLMLLFIAVVITETVIPGIRDIEHGRFDSLSKSAVFAELLRAAKSLASFFREHKKIVTGILIAACAVYFLVAMSKQILHIGLQPKNDEYQGAAEYIQAHSKPNAIVFLQRFDMYTRLSFFNDTNYYIACCANTFMYLYDEKMFWLWQNIVSGGYVCPKQTCSAADNADLYTTIRDVFNAEYIFIDASKKVGEFTVDNTERFTARLERDSRFTKVYTDPKYPNMMVYKL